METNVALTFSP